MELALEMRLLDDWGRGLCCWSISAGRDVRCSPLPKDFGSSLTRLQKPGDGEERSHLPDPFGERTELGADARSSLPQPRTHCLELSSRHSHIVLVLRARQSPLATFLCEGN